jgi:hypothetical protein
MPRRKPQRPVFASKFEQRLANDLERRKIAYEYEALKITYQRKPSDYIPDFVLPNGIIIEAKGYLSQSDRVKMKLIKEQHPALDIRFVFQRASNTISRKSKTTYAKWAERHGFPWAEGTVPKEWLEESPTKKGKKA